jgi:hypothetical protein
LLSPGISKSGAGLNVRLPSAAIENLATSVPLIVQVTAFEAVYVNTGVVFSGIEIVATEVAGAIAPPGPEIEGAPSLSRLIAVYVRSVRGSNALSDNASTTETVIIEF